MSAPQSTPMGKKTLTDYTVEKKNGRILLRELK